MDGHDEPMRVQEGGHDEARTRTRESFDAVDINRWGVLHV
jgi:hypothetical protein